MQLPPHLVSAIKSTHVAFEGLSHPLRIVSVDPAKTGEAGTIEITVETSHEGRTVQCVRPFRPGELNDEKRVTAALADAVRAELGSR